MNNEQFETFLKTALKREARAGATRPPSIACSNG